MAIGALIDSMESFFSEKRWILRGGLAREYDIADKQFQNAFYALSNEVVSPFMESNLIEDFKNDESSPLRQLLLQVVPHDLFSDFIEATKNIVSTIKNVGKQINNDDFLELIDVITPLDLSKNKYFHIVLTFAALRPIRQIIELKRKYLSSDSVQLLIKGLKISNFSISELIQITMDVYNTIQQPLLAPFSKVTTDSFKIFVKRKLITQPNNPPQILYLEDYIPYAEAADPRNHTNSIILSSYCTPSNLVSGRFKYAIGLSGYVAYKYNSTEELILAFRGTKNIKNCITDAIQYLWGFSFVYILAAGVAAEVCASTTLPVTIVGHSLGGGLAQYSAACINKSKTQPTNQLTEVKAIGFNSAGLHVRRYNKLKGNYTNISHLHLRNDIIMLYGQQLGCIYNQAKTVWYPYTAHLIKTMRQKASANIQNTYYKI